MRRISWAVLSCILLTACRAATLEQKRPTVSVPSSFASSSVDILGGALKNVMVSSSNHTFFLSNANSSSFDELRMTNSSVDQSILGQSVTVMRVIDGDTMEVQEANGTVERVRFVGIDTPEKYNVKKPQCYALEAAEYLRGLIEGKTVIITAKPQEDRDEYDRLLRYVFLQEHDVGLQMLADGYARNYPWFDHPQSQEYAVAEAIAKKEKRGLWDACGS